MRKFLSFPAAPVATGMRGVLVETVKVGMADVIVTASGTLDHDIARSYSAYYRGDSMTDDVELYRRGFHRLGGVVILANRRTEWMKLRWRYLS